MTVSAGATFGNFTFYILFLLVLIHECHPTKHPITDEFIEASNRKPPVPLSCHVCHSETHENCHNLTEDENGIFGYPKECVDKNSNFCLVRKFSFTLTDENQTWPMKTFGIKRNCAVKCEPGCVVMGERTRLYVCNSCCQGYACNIMSGSEPTYFKCSMGLWNWWTFLGIVVFVSRSPSIQIS